MSAYNAEIITKGLQKAYESFYDKIDLVNNIITTDPSNTAFWSVVETVSDAVVATAISLACLYALIGYIKEGINFNDDWKGLLKCVIRLILTKGLLQNATDIMLSIYKIGAGICSQINSNLSMSSSSITIADNPDGLIATILSYIKYLPFQFVLWACGVIILVISIGLIIQVCVYVMFAPISLAQFASGGFESIKNYLKDYFSICLQGAIMMGSMSLFSVLLSNKDIFGSFTDGYLGDVGLTIVYCLVLIKVLISSQSWARKMLS